MAWSIHAQNRNGARLGALKSATNRKFDFLLGVSVARFNLPLTGDDPIRDRFRAGKSEFTVDWNGAPQETVFAFTNASVNADGDQPELQCAGLGIASYLQDALIYGQDAQFAGTALPWTWINTFQSRTGGSYGITQGAVSGTPPTRYKTVQQDAELLGTIKTLAESGAGFDWGIDPLRRWREWHPTRGTNRGLVLEYGTNVLSFSYDEDAGPGDIINDIRVVGNTDGVSPKTASSATSRGLYGRREASLSYMGEYDVGVTDNQLQAYADLHVSDFAYPLVIPDVVVDPTKVPWGTYGLGDTVTFRARLGAYVEIDATYRIAGIHVNVDPDENEDPLALTLNKVVS